ncbi:mapk-regulated corepressor-interacting protein 1 isoform X1 [Salmo salar]|uniref:C16orf14 n=2 Tax=Salmo TaxID=8028 RepID=B9EQB6_SALSA|nr:mapk-regulated corepressor-interacting protein 1 isoform X1 [Salmo salar]XP_029621881.1 mapk-regulated corepressor-interacting protein 1-like isoform X1 [Salmo trutta]ACM09713.1 C16orf14 [Salmo salar]|eukprot:XP_014058986.1 PREDICTED: protein FAM195B-like isoform X1 [Salmo salar]
MPEKHMFCFPACLFCVFILSCCFVCFLFVSLLLYSSSAPRMVNNYKRTSSPRSPTNSGELFTPAHEENVRFIHDTWQCVLRDIRSPQSSERKDRGPQEYVEKNPNPNLNSFTPVDLSDLKKRNTQDSKKS